MMERVQPIRVEPLTEEAFRPFGQVLAATARSPDYRGDGGAYGWRVGFQADGTLRVSVSVAPFQGLAFRKLERHFHVTQTFVPLEGSPAVVAVAGPTDPETIPRPEAVRAFLIDGSKGYLLAKGTWHSLDRFPLAPPATVFVVLNEEETARDPARSQIVDYAARMGTTFQLLT
jgi:ureidoglycolate lyase